MSNLGGGAGQQDKLFLQEEKDDMLDLVNKV